MLTIPTKTILSGHLDNQRGTSWFGYNYNMNLYRGCNHGCIYCDSRSECYHVDNFDQVRVKENALLILENELRTKRKKGMVGIGAMSDSYNSFEKECKVTRGSLALLHEYGFGVGFSTKSDLVLRDIDILKEMKKQVPVTVKFTITAYEDELCKKIEPNTSLTSKRFQALEQLSSKGINTGILMMPILPFIEDDIDNIKNIVKTAHECGVSYIFPGFGVTLRQNQRQYYYDKLRDLFPGMQETYVEQYGNQYSCDSPRKKELWDIFRKECNQYKIAYQMKDIVSIIHREYEVQQLSLFP